MRLACGTYPPGRHAGPALGSRLNWPPHIAQVWLQLTTRRHGPKAMNAADAGVSDGAVGIDSIWKRTCWLVVLK